MSQSEKPFLRYPMIHSAIWSEQGIYQRKGYVHKNPKWIPWKRIVQSMDLLLFFHPIGFYSLTFSKRKRKILYFYNPIALLTLEGILLISMLFLIHICLHSRIKTK
uniref:Uncharacterized protein n=1 Tax=Thalassia hemprichii TaxID=55496 RepID=A0A4Y1KCJ4_9LILI|nr:hypothetical protein [Thalassia hemprichii]ATP74887.1 hypothetical protein [Thalassia hemprichii]